MPTRNTPSDICEGQLEEYVSPLTFCQAKLAIPGAVSSFGCTDMAEDVDGCLLATYVAGGGNVANWMKAH